MGVSGNAGALLVGIFSAPHRLVPYKVNKGSVGQTNAALFLITSYGDQCTPIKSLGDPIYSLAYGSASCGR